METRLSRDEFNTRFKERSKIFSIALEHDEELYKPLIKQVITGDRTTIDITDYSTKLVFSSMKRLVDLVYLDFENSGQEHSQ